MAKTAEVAAPFLKWAGGKGQLSHQIDRHLPVPLKTGKLKRYVEPFIGGGAVFFHVAQHYTVSEYVISDTNPELILVYKSIQENVDELIHHLSNLQHDYNALNTESREVYFYEHRTALNALKTEIDLAQPVNTVGFQRAAQIIFLNRTCYNGLYRVNRKGEFNVPYGRYKNPRICSPSNLRAVSQTLNRATIRFGDYAACEDAIDDQTFVYFDPPYRPISKTASFKAYAKTDFNDDEQLRLAQFYRMLDEKNAYLMLSNSDPQNTNPEDTFFLDAYEGFQIERVQALRMINSNAQKRGPVNELLILNY